MSTKQQVKIYGKTYTVKETESDIPIAKLAEYVDSRMKDLAGPKSRMGATDVAVLAALNIAQELLECRHDMEIKEKENKKVFDEIDHKVVEMSQALARELKP